MNTFAEHHQDRIRFGYRCFDRLLLNGIIQPFQQPERVVGFFWTYRQLYPVDRDTLRDIATQYHHWVVNQARHWHVPIQGVPAGRRDEFMDRPFTRARPDQVVAILKAREPARIMTAIGNKQDNRWHLELKSRWVDQYNFYINDARWGRMFVRVCPYFPFSARVYLNQHHWLAQRLRERGIPVRQCGNAFLHCGNPEALQALADSLTPQDIRACGQKWLAALTPFFTPREREQAGCQHRLFFAQTEYCDNLIFKRRAAVDALGERLFDANRLIGRPDNRSPLGARGCPGLLGGTPAKALAFNRDDLRVVDQAIDEGDGAARVGEDGRPVREGQVGGQHQTFPFIPSADDLEEEVGGAGIVGKVPELV